MSECIGVLLLNQQVDSSGILHDDMYHLVYNMSYFKSVNCRLHWYQQQQFTVVWELIMFFFSLFAKTAEFRKVLSTHIYILKINFF